jgi:uncharacterized membrane protein YeaQ/YmgE (transglycosylase-associated protein family)
MGLISCILFGLLTAWLGGVLYPAWKLPGIRKMFISGLSGACLGVLVSRLLNIAYFSQFNLFSLLFSVLSVLLIMWLYAKRNVNVLH